MATQKQKEIGVKFTRELAITAARDWFDKTQKTLESTMRDFKNYIARFELSLKDEDENPDLATLPSTVISWTVNNLMSLPNNFRLDEAVQAVSRLDATDKES